MKKTIALATVAVMVLLIAGAIVYAAAPEQATPGRYQPPTLTDSQKQELAPLYQQALDTQKQVLQKYVDFGYITQWQADQQAAMMKDRMDQRLQQGFIPGMMGPRHGHGMMGKGPGFGHGPCAQQQAPGANQNQ
jgi:hypothetical protein